MQGLPTDCCHGANELLYNQLMHAMRVHVCAFSNVLVRRPWLGQAFTSA